jgi:hypothetical protein
LVLVILLGTFLWYTILITNGILAVFWLRKGLFLMAHYERMDTLKDAAIYDLKCQQEENERKLGRWIVRPGQRFDGSVPLKHPTDESKVF